MDSRIAAVVLMSILMTAGVAQVQIVDPFEVIAAFDHAAEMDLWPGFDATAYPMADLENYRLLLLEEESLARAVESETAEATATWAAGALAIRNGRMASLAAHDIPPAALTAGEEAAVADRAGAAVARLAAEREALSEDFAARSKRVIVRLADANESLEMVRFDPMAVEVLDRGEALQAHLLNASHPRGELELNNPHFVRGSLDGVIALTVPAGDHPFLDGFREVSMAGFSSDPTVVIDGDTITVTAEGLSGVFTGTSVESSDDELIITVPPAELVEKSSEVASHKSGSAANW